jgi:hypothetical protein
MKKIGPQGEAGRDENFEGRKEIRGRAGIERGVVTGHR